MLSQTIWFTVFMAIGRCFVFLLYLEAARRLGPSVFGVFGTQTTYLMVSTILSSFGIDLWMSRHCASHKISIGQVITFAILRIFFTIIFLITILGVSQLPMWGKAIQGYEAPFLLLVASLLFDHIALTCGAVLEGRRRIKKSGFLSFVRAIFLALLGYIFIVKEASLFSLSMAFLIASMVRSGLALYWCRHECDAQTESIKALSVLRQAAPMAFLNMMVALYFHIDMLMLPELANLAQTGIYKVAYTFIEASLMISASISTALYPLFSGAQVSTKDKVDQLYIGLKMLWFLAGSIAAGCLVTGQSIIEFIFGADGAYPEAGLALMVLSWAIPFMFANGVLVRFHLGRHHQTAVLKRVMNIAMLNIVLNLFLIPRFGYMGAGIATVLSEAILTILLFHLVPGSKRQFLVLAVKAFVIAILVFSTALALSFLQLFAQIILTAFFITFFLHKSKWLRLAELKSFGRI